MNINQTLDSLHSTVPFKLFHFLELRPHNRNHQRDTSVHAIESPLSEKYISSFGDSVAEMFTRQCSNDTFDPSCQSTLVFLSPTEQLPRNEESDILTVSPTPNSCISVEKPS